MKNEISGAVAERLIAAKLAELDIGGIELSSRLHKKVGEPGYLVVVKLAGWKASPLWNELKEVGRKNGFLIEI